MADYSEEIYERAENKFKDIDKQIKWLNDTFSSPDHSSDYTRQALEVRDDLEKVKDLNKEINNANTYDEIDDLKSRADEIDLGASADVRFKINNKFKELEEVEVEQQEEFTAEAEGLKYTYKNSEDESEREEALRQLESLDKRIAAAVKGWSTRRRNQALRIADV
jgi:hypothetical protein